MKRKIEQLLNETYEYHASEMTISEEQIDVSVIEGDVFRGSFELENAVPKKMRGFIYSSNGRVGYEPAAFYSMGEKVRYEADTTGLLAGDTLEGEFIICADIGEYRVPYRILVTENKEKRKFSVVTDLETFCQLAKEDFQKAYVLFLSAEFSNMLQKKYPKWVPLYDGLRRQSVNYGTLEEFLVSTGMKNSVLLTLDKEDASYESLKQPVKEIITVAKESWGFQRVDISVDAPFLQIEHSVLTTDEFLGRKFQLEYWIDPAKLHAGKNYGYITLKTRYQTLRFAVAVWNRQRKPDGISYLEQHHQVAGIVKNYISYRLGRLEKKLWCQDAQDRINKYKFARGNNALMELFEAYVMFEEERDEGACLLLERLESHEERLNTSEMLGVFLYLTTFYNEDREYLAYVEENLKRLFRQSPDNWWLQYLLIALPTGRSMRPSEKFEAYQQQYVYGCRSRLMYMEAYQLVAENPLLLRKLEPFEMQILKFACQEKVLTADIVMQATELAGRYKKYSAGLFAILADCYEFQPSSELTEVICRLLIKGNKTGSKYFIWYERGVEADLRITGLYEYYINSLGEQLEYQPLPRIIKMYFTYENALSYQKKAQVYANIIKNKKIDKESYESYRPLIENFMVDQLNAGKMDRNMAVIYKTFLTRAVLNKRMAEHLARALFTYDLKSEMENIRMVIVVHRQLKEEQRVMLSKGHAYIQLYSKDYQIFLEDQKGVRHASGIHYTLTSLLPVSQFLEYCRELIPDNSELILYTCGAAKEINSENIKQFLALLHIDKVKADYKRHIRQEVLNYYHQNQDDDTLYECFMEMDYDLFICEDKPKVIELLAAAGIYETAFLLSGQYGPEGVNPASLVKICSRTIHAREIEVDEMLLYICYYCFDKGKYDETVLSYLLKFYDGPIETMKRLWEAGKQFELDTFELEEKIIMVLLFTGTETEDTEKIFDSYRRKLGKKKLLTAYVLYQAYNYFVREKTVDTLVFDQIERGYEKGTITQDTCLLALLRWYAEKTDLTCEQEKNKSKLLETYICRDMRFAFYQDLSPALTRAFAIHDKSFIEYRTKPGAKVILQYHKEGPDGEETAVRNEGMRHVFQGIFVSEVTIFYGEKIVYQIAEEHNGVYQETDELILEWQDKGRGKQPSRYDLLNDLSREDNRHTLQNYLEIESLMEGLFTLS